MKKIKVVMVEWNDATAPLAHWGQDVHVMPCKSIGFLVRKTKMEVVLAKTLAEDGDFGGLFAVPRGFITKISKVGKL